MKQLLFYIFCIVAFSTIKAQVNDSLRKAYVSDSLKSKQTLKKAIYSKARTATILSACLPGLGQAYNKKYWKTPIVLAVIGGAAYWSSYNHKQYKFYSNNLKAENDNDSSTINTTNFDTPYLLNEKKYYKKYRDVGIIVVLAGYVLNMIDANVDAHLSTFDVSDDLSLQIKPYYNFNFNTNLLAGISFKLKFK